jgi:hypothetical protein
MAATSDRLASNEAAFAAANDAIAETAQTLTVSQIPFLCECPDTRCSEIALMTMGEYAALRLFPNRFLISAHCRTGDVSGALLVETNPRYSVVDRPSAA